MRSKSPAPIKGNRKPTIHNGIEFKRDREEPSLLRAIETNIQESFDEIDILRGTVQYWESRRTATDSKEHIMLTEAFRVMHGELLGLTARMKELLERELAQSPENSHV